MRAFLIKGGDLVVGGSAGFQTVSHRKKVQQDLGLAISEPVGTDRFHPNFGSSLPSYIGTAQTDITLALIEGEIRRVIANYNAIQTAQVQADILARVRSRIANDEIISRIDKIDIKQTYDAVTVRVYIVTRAGDTLLINRTFTEGS
jgi:phage baseplate assembly protein W